MGFFDAFCSFITGCSIALTFVLCPVVLIVCLIGIIKQNKKGY